MNRCEFCPKYNPGFEGKPPKCEMFVGSSYCEEAISKMTAAMKNMQVSPMPKKQDGMKDDEDVKKLMAYFFGI